LIRRWLPQKSARLNFAQFRVRIRFNLFANIGVFSKIGVALLLISTSAASAGASLTSVIADTDYPPFYFKTDDGQLAGVSIDVCTAVAAQLGYQLKFVELPFPRVLESLASGKTDMACTLFNTRERAPGLVYTSVPHAFENIHFIYQASVEPPTLATLSQYAVGDVIGYYYGEHYRDSHLSQVTHYNNDRLLVKNFLYRRVAVVVSNPATFRWHAERINSTNQNWQISPTPLYTGPIYMAFARDKPQALELASRFTQAVLVFRQTEEYKAILKKYDVPLPDF